MWELLTLGLLSWADMYPTHMLSVVWLHRNSTVNKRETITVRYRFKKILRRLHILLTSKKISILRSFK